MYDRLPVLVVGAGPVGLACALCLLKNGIPARIIEKANDYHNGARGTAIQPRTQEALSFLGVLEDVLETSTPPLLLKSHGPDGQEYKAVVWSQGADDSPGTPYRSIASTSQASLERVLREHIQKLGNKVEIGVELIGLEQDEDKVVAHVLRHQDGQEESVQCAYLVGADGSKGRTRKLVGINFLGETKNSERLLSANVYVTGPDRETWSMWGNFATAGVGLKPLKPEPLFQLQALGPELPVVLPTDLAGIRDLFYNISGRKDIQIHSVEHATEWRANIRMAEKFSSGKIFLAGDAAHAHSPMGGQGTNSGIQDAINLAWKLAMVYHKHASPKLLHTYDEERLPVIAEMLNLTTTLHAYAYGRNLPSESVSALEASSGKGIDMENAMFRPKTLLQLGVNYRWSSIVMEGRTSEDGNAEDGVNEPVMAQNPYGQNSTRLRAGDRAPDAPGLIEVSTSGSSANSTLRLFTLFDIRRHLIVVFPGDEEAYTTILPSSIEVLARYEKEGLASTVVVLARNSVKMSTLNGYPARVFFDSESNATQMYGVGGDTFVVIRPDGIIGAFALTVEDVGRYFERLMSA